MKEEKTTNFANLTQSPEVLGAFLSSLPVLEGTWDEEFHRRYCDGCTRADCDGGEGCPNSEQRNNPLWWLKLGGRRMKLLIGGSPCTHWSIAQTKNRETEASGIGWELFLNYRIARDKYQPDYFLYENNKSMSSAIRAQITAELGVEPVLINSALVSAQNRQRLYWAGKRNPDGTYSQVPVEQPEDRGILLRDILETAAGEKGYALDPAHAEVLNVNPSEHGINGAAIHCDGKSRTLTTNKGEGPKIIIPVRVGTIENDVKNPDHDSHRTCVAEPVVLNMLRSGKARTVDAHMGKLESCLVPRMNDPNPAKQQYDCIAELACPPMRVREATKLGYTDIQPGECVDLAMPQSKTRRGRAMKDKTNCLTTSCEFYEYCGTLDAPIYQVRDGMITVKGKECPIKLRDGCYIIRKLTVRECMRLQTVPETYVFPVSPSQAYKMLGNGWTVDVIAHIMGHFEGLTAGPVEVLSMYDGMSCGHIALDKLGAEIASYHATEIDKFAIQTTQANFPDVVQLGDAFQVREDGWTYAGLTGGTSEEAE